MADEKEKPKSNILRKNTIIPEEKQGDFIKFLNDRKEGKDSGKFSPESEAILEKIKLSAIHMAAMERAFLAKGESEKTEKENNVIISSFSSEANNQLIDIVNSKEGEGVVSKEFEKTYDKGNDILENNKDGDNEEDKSDRTVKLPSVEVAKYSNEALKQMGIVKPKIKEEGEDSKKDKDTGFLVKLFKAAIPLIVMGGGLIGSIKGMMQGGPMQGIMNMLSKVFLVLADSFAKKLPGMNIVGKFFMGKTGFVARMMAKLFGKAGAVTKIFGKGGAKLGLGIFKGIGKAFLKRLPIIGSLISIGSAITRLKNPNGPDFLGALLDLGAAIAYMFPFVGTPLGLAFDLLNASSDVYGAKNNMGKSEAIGTMLVNVGKWIYEKISSIFDNMLQGMVDMLYGAIPDKFVDMGLDALGLQRYKHGASGKIENDIAAKKEALQELQNKKLDPNDRRGASNKAKAIRDINSDIAELERELSKSYDTDLEDGVITRDEYLLKKVDKMVVSKDGGIRKDIRSDLLDKGYSTEDINKTFLELKKSMDEQTEVIKEQKETTPPIVSNSQSSSSVINNYSHSGNSTKKQRGGRRSSFQYAYS
jgi:hypothetical protein